MNEQKEEEGGDKTKINFIDPGPEVSQTKPNANHRLTHPEVTPGKNQG